MKILGIELTSFIIQTANKTQIVFHSDLYEDEHMYLLRNKVYPVKLFRHH